MSIVLESRFPAWLTGRLLLVLLLLLGAPTLEAAAAGMPWSASSSAGLASGARQVVAGDLDGDGDPDLAVVADIGDEVFWLENDDGAWIEHPVATNQDGAAALAVGDIDGDGTLDIVAGLRDADSIRWWSNENGDGSAWLMAEIASMATGGGGSRRRR